METNTELKKRSNNQKSEEQKQSDRLAKQEYFKKISTRITNKLVEKCIEYQTLADYLGISKQNLYAYMKAEGHYFSPQMLEKIADFFGCSVDNLLGKYEEDSKSLSGMAKYTGISGKSLKILHEGVENDNEYLLLVDMFEYLLQQYRIHRINTQPVRVDNEANKMMECIAKAFEVMQRDSVVENFIRSFPNDHKMTDKSLRMLNYILMEYRESAPDEAESFLHKASEHFREAMFEFIDKKSKNDADYFRKLRQSFAQNVQLVGTDLDVEIIRRTMQKEENKSITDQLIWNSQIAGEVLDEAWKKE